MNTIEQIYEIPLKDIEKSPQNVRITDKVISDIYNSRLATIRIP